MGASKSDLFTTEQNKLSNIFKALSHPAKIAIIERISQTGSCISNDLVKILPLSQPTISKHLKELKQAEIIESSIKGNAIYYSINKEIFDELNDRLSIFLNVKSNTNV